LEKNPVRDETGRQQRRSFESERGPPHKEKSGSVTVKTRGSKMLLSLLSPEECEATHMFTTID
jgi:hypothetical protein